MVRYRRSQYRYDIRNQQGVPHLITFTLVRAGNNIERAAAQLATDIRSRVLAAVMRHTGWNRNQAIERTRGVLVATGGERADRPMAQQRRGHNSSAMRIPDLTEDSLNGDTLIDRLIAIRTDGSDENIDFWEITWEFWINPAGLVGGASQNVRKPKWHTAVAYSQTWKGYQDDLGNISCAAFSICWGLYSSVKSRHYERINNAIQDARALMTELGWDEFVVVDDLAKFVQKYPTKKLVVVNPYGIQAIKVFVGTEFNKEREEKLVLGILLLTKRILFFLPLTPNKNIMEELETLRL